MADWAFSNLTISSKNEDILNYISKRTNNEKENIVFSLEKIKETPRELLDIESGSLTSFAMDYIRGIEKEKVLNYIKDRLSKKDFLCFVKKIKNNLDNYGHPTWYEWRCENWGTKWETHNSNSVRKKGEISYYFETAWFFPREAINTLYKDVKERFPNDDFVFDVKVEIEGGEFKYHYSLPNML